MRLLINNARLYYDLVAAKIIHSVMLDHSLISIYLAPTLNFFFNHARSQPGVIMVWLQHDIFKYLLNHARSQPDLNVIWHQYAYYN